MKYQVGDLFYASYDENSLFIITEIPEEDVHIITCMRTYKCYGYNKEGIEHLFRKVA